MTALVTTGDLISAADWNSLSQVIHDETLSVATTTVTISSIPSTFAHLRLVINARAANAAAAALVFLQFNADATSNYITQRLVADATTVTATRSAVDTTLNLGGIPAANATAAHSGSIVVDIPDYSNSNWRQRIIVNNSYRSGTAGPVVGVHAGEWTSSAASIARIDLTAQGDFVADSRFTLYGHRGL